MMWLERAVHVVQAADAVDNGALSFVCCGHSLRIAYREASLRRLR